MQFEAGLQTLLGGPEFTGKVDFSDRSLLQPPSNFIYLLGIKRFYRVGLSPELITFIFEGLVEPYETDVTEGRGPMGESLFN